MRRALPAGEHSLEDFCENSFIRRAMLTILLFLLALLLGAIGLVLLHRGNRPQGKLWSGIAPGDRRTGPGSKHALPG